MAATAVLDRESSLRVTTHTSRFFLFLSIVSLAIVYLSAVDSSFSSMLPSRRCSLQVNAPFLSSRRVSLLSCRQIDSSLPSSHFFGSSPSPLSSSRYIPFSSIGSSLVRGVDSPSVESVPPPFSVDSIAPPPFVSIPPFSVESILPFPVESIPFFRRLDSSPSSSILCIALQKHFHFSRFLFSLLFSFQQKNFGGVCHHMMSNFWVCGNLVGLDFSHPIRCFSTVHHLFRVCTRQRFTVGRALDSYGGAPSPTVLYGGWREQRASTGPGCTP